jgi:hypothetical protein
MKTRDKFIAFVDILGFTNMVEAAEENGGDVTLALDLARALGTPSGAAKIQEFGHIICPAAPFMEKGVRFEVTQVSDCAVVSCEVSPAGLITLVHHCVTAAMTVVSKGGLCRGIITKGSIFHEAGQFLGNGYMEAFKAERSVAFRQSDISETGTPFIQLDPAVVAYAQQQDDRCVRSMFERMTTSDGTYTAIDPFRPLANVPSALINLDFDPRRWKASVDLSLSFRLSTLARYEAADQNAPGEKERLKIRHYKRGLEDAIARLHQKGARLDEMIETGVIPYGSLL